MSLLPDQRDDLEFALASVSQSGALLRYASERLRNDKSVVLAAVRQDNTAFEWASDELKNDPDVKLAANVN